MINVNQSAVGIHCFTKYPQCWHALQVKTNHELSIMSSPLADGIEFFHPTYSEDSRRGNKRVVIQRPFFPGYLFSRFRATDSGLVRQIGGVFDVVSFGDGPAVIPDEQIISVRNLVASGRDVTSSEYVSLSARPGDAVEVIRGSLKGTRGVLVEVRGKTHAVFVVTLELLRRSLKATLPREWLKPLPANRLRTA